MIELPESGYLSGATRTHGEMKTAFETIRDAVAELQGTVPELQAPRHALILESGNWEVPAGVTSLELLVVAGGAGGGGGGNGGTATDGGAGGSGGASEVSYDGGAWTVSVGAPAGGPYGRATGAGGHAAEASQHFGEDGDGASGTQSGGARIESPLAPKGRGGAGGDGVNGGGAGASGGARWAHAVQTVEPGKTLAITIGEGGAAGAGSGVGGTAGEAGIDGAVMIRW